VVLLLKSGIGFNIYNTFLNEYYEQKLNLYYDDKPEFDDKCILYYDEKRYFNIKTLYFEMIFMMVLFFNF
jgi:hypothetical protein